LKFTSVSVQGDEGFLLKSSLNALGNEQLASIVLAGPALLFFPQEHPHNTPSALDLSV
jgi:hypothetical protein